ncbi:ATP-binding protein [Lactobacillus ultunensis]|uniref:ATPase, AAA family n=1 Tax=Lactobacillus ultunensis DSM 16047 TaxID=525365 RepID=C2EPP4_9LACO|nr:ATP-binding protein [Lactobacillus ultunensis]EEJ71483.1 ATPase, AAA family [Lactobacillus ultunensis DSM 16047]KRL80372.1 AAA ATPase family protein [Lactobacillus ultunensis DSM 16047]QQP28292.1 AAA family ATPase [Lactobacillus ultunensis]
MKKSDVVDLIKYHVDKNNVAFKQKALEIADEFKAMGDIDIGSYINSLLATQGVFVPQEIHYSFKYLHQVSDLNKTVFKLPDSIYDDLRGIMNAINRNNGINKFLFVGKPGTGKTESVKVISKILNKTIYKVDFDSVIDSRLGQTAKNISELFNEINNIPYPEKVIVLMDEIDAIALDRISSNDIREMGRATTAVLKGLDELNSNIILIATTNLYKYLDDALSRRFNLIVNFNQYSTSDLMDVAVAIMNDIYKDTDYKISRNIKLFKKIVGLYDDKIPLPGNLNNVIRTTVAFSDPNDPNDYLVRLYKAVSGEKMNISQLSEEGFTLREIGILTGKSKSSVARILEDK